ncbi:Lsr2 family protein [Klugiella xanthotipulae]|uniref:Lsr2 protein n=1 Tax=Klugiella xanthotipulae TaxID=244735 RepID=A0A543I4T3_9MICO|nr:Lsr2 family protein [Klugiella xanthotipulae]TQM65612.1 Lsr2 protein [Klugiella xanthotipulae]
MAQKVITILIDDLTKEEISAEQGETVRFGLDDTDYIIDLSAENADELRATFKKYIDHARKASSVGTRAARGTAKPKKNLGEIREWLRANGHNVSDRGRIPNELIELFHNK